MMRTQWAIKQRFRSPRSSRNRCAAALVAASLSWVSPHTVHAAANVPFARIALAAGVIEGEKTAYAGTELRAFRGIPYAAAPVGELRWKPPQPVTAWAGVRSATQFGARCMQLPLFPVEFRSKPMSEDCLFLNVWTPARTGTDKLPVLVYFHGGGFAPHTIILEAQPPTPESWRTALQRLFGQYANEVLALYPGNDDDEVRRSATSLASDIFIRHATRRWVDLHREPGGAPVYFYLYTHKRPTRRNPEPGQLPEDGAVHSSEIEYALGTLTEANRFAWRPEDHAVSRIFSGYIAHFVKTGTPNDPSLPPWPVAREQEGGLLRQRIDTDTQTITDAEAARHAFLSRYNARNPLLPEHSHR